MLDALGEGGEKASPAHVGSPHRRSLLVDEPPPGVPRRARQLIGDARAKRGHRNDRPGRHAGSRETRSRAQQPPPSYALATRLQLLDDRLYLTWMRGPRALLLLGLARHQPLAREDQPRRQAGESQPQREAQQLGVRIKDE